MSRFADSLRSHWRLALAWFVAGAGALALGIALLGLATVEFGLYDTTATKEHGAFASWAAHTTFIRATQKTARDAPAPPSFSPDQVQAGMALYHARCELCHGGPATPRAAWVAGINPTPPFLLDSARRWNAAELHAIIANGVKMTAMPAWRYTLTDAQVWTLVAFLESLPSTPPSRYLQARAALDGGAGERPR